MIEVYHNVFIYGDNVILYAIGSFKTFFRLQLTL